MNDCFQNIPFGESLPLENPHAISVSMPFLQNVIDYEEGDEVVLGAMKSGYPRFFQNKFVEKLVSYIQEKHQISNEKVVLPIASLHAKSILEYLVQYKLEYIEEDENVFLIVENNPELVKKCSDYIRNIGLLISSRKAENTLYKLGEIPTIFKEDKISDLPEKVIKTVLSKAYSDVVENNILLTNCGMNALFSACETILNCRKSEFRNTVVQLGWLYVDTMEIIEKRNNFSYVQIHIYDKLQLESWLEANHSHVATLLTEITTNPLIQCVDLPWLSNLCKKYNIILIVDVTIATPFNVDVLPYCDIVVESLTKFACGSCDLLMGAIVLNDTNEIIKANKNQFEKFIVPAYDGEKQRLAFQIKKYESRVKKVSENTKIVYNYLKGQPFIKEIYSVFHNDSIENFQKIQKSSDVFPGLLSVVFDKELDFYYDKLQLAKGPSLGTEFTLAMPYVYLAHYEYLKSNDGKQKLLALGINPNILRLSIGIEPVEKIISAFEKLKHSAENVKIN
ncbi:PLP-dependent transferase [Flavobacterium jejuense]|uniref:PLP-dependent transferase n=1 Tax=Flavobacterium jejuense TaxID=1544455 RepID=A0ABX0IW13_9FLAO|nr:PLP-dependent transferase [Flavobacterium jejuense]NHN27648.1 PLP-dependent transferase [Flavobacterium jejuense]